MQHGLEIHARAADENRQLVLPFRFGQSGFGVGEPQADGIVALGADMAEKQMRNIAHFLGRGAGREDRQIAINRHGIGVDHDAVFVARELNREGGLAAGRRPCQKDGLDIFSNR